MMKKKIAFVVHRYGVEVNGGAETYCRVMAERLSACYDVEVLTSCALDYMTWKDYYEPGESNINGITVRRFRVDYPRNVSKFNRLNEKLVLGDKRTVEDEEKWVDAQGPTSTQLIRYLETNHMQYQAVLFVTYLYYHTVRGMEKIKDKAILIPTAHDEPPIYYSIYEKVFNAPKAIVYLTDEERMFVQNTFYNKHILSEVIGMGIDIPIEIDSGSFKQRYALNHYILYVGRIDESKGCKKMFEYFIKYKQEYPGDLKLVLMGKATMKIPTHKDIINLGFVSEEDKFGGIQGADIFILPSPYESFSIALLEAMAVGVPCIVNEKCSVLRGHAIKSKASLFYSNYSEFKYTIELLKNEQTLRYKMRLNGKKYVKTMYTWETIIEKWKYILESIS